MPRSTYRLQLHADFGFAAAKRRLDYLQRLGISHLYLSPILTAAHGSMHGYDVIDHRHVSEELGGIDGFVELAEAAHRRGIGVVVDIVPNHMAIPVPAYLNEPWWDLLEHGRESDRITWFDIDWDLWNGRVGLPLLDGPLDQALAAGTLRTAEVHGRPVLQYGEQVLPLARRSEQQSLPGLLESQHYRLGSWHDPDSLGYRRFFDVDSLVAIRVEDELVFDATHRLLFDLYRGELIDGFRIDHPDGLADPEGYLERLRDRTGGAWVVVEKVLTPGERLAGSWPCAGTTGYDGLQAVSAALAPSTGGFLTGLWRDLGGEPMLEAEEERAKRQVVDEVLQPELRRLVRCAASAAAVTDDHQQLDEAIAELLAFVGVYRAYVRIGREPPTESLAVLDRLVEQAVRSRPDLAAPLGRLRQLLADSTDRSPAVQELVVRFQQVCGPVMAKGVEDTTFYRWHRLVALEEVGGDPDALDEPGPDALHGWAARQAESHPTGMTTLSTHDTKRSEDVRARLLAVADDTEGWATGWAAVRAIARQTGLDLPTGYLLFQTLVGSWPIGADRLHAYLQKAVREAKQHTSWREPDEPYERLVAETADACLVGPVAASIDALLEQNREPIRGATLAAKLVGLTMPGVPDTYQGCETVRVSLVDPDNRRPVDYDRLAAILDGLDRGRPPRGLEEEKLYLTAQVLRLRRAEPQLFDHDAGYRPLPQQSRHLLGFCRADRLATVVTRSLASLPPTGWGDRAASLPSGRWTDVLGGSPYEVGRDGIPCRELFADRPVALLRKDAG